MVILTEQEINDFFKVPPGMADYIKINSNKYSKAYDEFIKALSGTIVNFINEKLIIEKEVCYERIHKKN
jgi:hypothetical protein